MEKLTPQEKIEKFFEQYKSLEMKRGEAVLRPEENGTSIYFIKKGYVSIHMYSNEGKELTALIIEPKEIFPLATAIDDYHNDYWFEAITPLNVYKAPIDDFRKFITSDIEIMTLIAAQAIRHLNAAIYRLQHIILGKANTTVASVILVYAKILGNEKENKIDFKVPITHQNIAFSAGITRETASLEVKKLQNKGIIGYNGRKIVVENLKKLQEEAYL